MQSVGGDESRLSDPRNYHCVYENPTISKNNSLFLPHIFATGVLLQMQSALVWYAPIACANHPIPLSELIEWEFMVIRCCAMAPSSGNRRCWLCAKIIGPSASATSWSNIISRACSLCWSEPLRTAASPMLSGNEHLSDKQVRDRYRRRIV
jgi:hypothetical protein